MDLPTEMRLFHEHHAKNGSKHFVMLPSEDFAGLDDYVEYLTTEINLGAHNAEVNGGAQFRRVMGAVETKKRDVIQARGVSMSSLTWRDVVVKLLGNEAPGLRRSGRGRRARLAGAGPPSPPSRECE